MGKKILYTYWLFLNSFIFLRSLSTFIEHILLNKETIYLIEISENKKYPLL